MSATTPDQAAAALSWRYATKLFDPQARIPADQWQILLDSLRLAPSSFGLQPWKFIVIEDPALRESLKGMSWGQDQVTDADRLVVLAARTDLGQSDIDRWVGWRTPVRRAEV